MAVARTEDFSRKLLIRLFALTLVLSLAALGTFSYAAIGAFEREMLPEIHRKAALVGRTVRNDVVRAVGYGVPFDGLVGMGEFLGDVLAANPDVRYLVLADAGGTVLYAGGADRDEAVRMIAGKAAETTDPGDAEPRRLAGFFDTALPIAIDGGVRGVLHVGIADDLVRRRLAAIGYDAVTVLLVTLLVTFEFLFNVVMVYVVGPIRRIEELLGRGRDGDLAWRVPQQGSDEVGRFGRAFNGLVRRVNELYHDLVQDAEEAEAAQIDPSVVARIRAVMDDLGRRYRLAGEKVREMANPNSMLRIRIPFFLFMLAEELTRPFLPVFIRGLHQPDLGLTPQMTVGLPISVFMLSIAVVTPWAATWTDRFGVRKVFLMGAVPSVAGFIGSAFADSVLDLLVWRSLCGLGYAITYIACQSYVAENSRAESRVSGMAFIMGAVFAAAICGPSLGGILADRVGFSATFAVSGGLVLLASVMINRFLAESPAAAAVERPAPTVSPGVRRLLRNPRFLALAVFAAVPAKIILTGVLFYLVPLYLTELGDNQSSIGRVLMVYGLMNVAIMPLAARFANRLTNLPSLVGLGAVISGAGAMSVLAADDTWLVLLAVTVVGVGHAVSIAPQLVLVQIVCERVDPTISRTKALGAFRLIERFGNVIGPFLVAGLLSAFDYSRAMAYTGMLVAACGVIFLILSARSEPRPVQEAIP